MWFNRTIYIDAEFNGFGGDLISFAAVPGGGGDEFYGVVSPPSDLNPWVAANVIPHLRQAPEDYSTMRARFQAWLAALAPSVTVVADWPEDLIHFHRLLLRDAPGMMMAIRVITLCEKPPVPAVSATPHNALSDARALRVAYQQAELPIASPQSSPV